MENRKRSVCFRIIASVLLLLAVITGLCACTETVETGESGRTSSANSWKPERHFRESTSETGDTTDPGQTTPAETTVITPTETTVPDLDYIKSICVYSVWYDAVIDNPAEYDSISSDDAFALKGVFYFNTPLTASFKARLYKDGAVLLVRDVNLRDNVTAEADFSAGLEGLGTFESGEYYIELVFDGKPVAVTSTMRVK